MSFTAEEWDSIKKANTEYSDDVAMVMEPLKNEADAIQQKYTKKALVLGWPENIAHHITAGAFVAPFLDGCIEHGVTREQWLDMMGKCYDFRKFDICICGEQKAS